MCPADSFFLYLRTSAFSYTRSLLYRLESDLLQNKLYDESEIVPRAVDYRG